ncbi:MAG: hypothetical protein DRP87_16830 [Spirochaetes bacterium]|nr:MAG: hypothetical protein DRP87_16830 [Spirochaetota bacterium]
MGIGDFYRAAFYAVWLSMILLYRGQFDKVYHISKELKTSAEDYKNQMLFTAYYIIIGSFLYAKGDFGQASKWVQKTIEFVEQTGQQYNRAILLSFLARSLLYHGELNKSKQIVEKLNQFPGEEKTIIPYFVAAPVYISIIAYYCSLADQEYNGRLSPKIKRATKVYIKRMLKNSNRYIHYYP